MTATITKGQIVQAVADLPEDATVDDAIERLLFLSKIEQGLQRGETLSHEEVKQRIEARIASWQEAIPETVHLLRSPPNADRLLRALARAREGAGLAKR
ncbi:MAG: hypothetical protein Rubg2KO_25820 [Rubricoccaceae bacterium]